MSPDAFAIRDAALALFKDKSTDPDALFQTVRPVRTDFEPSELPGLIISLTKEQMAADGALSVGQPRFVHDLSMFVGVKVSGKTRAQAEARVALRMKLVLETLLQDPAFVSSVDGFSRIDITNDTDKPGQGEFYLAFSIAEFVIQYRTAWAPRLEDDLEEVRIAIRQLDADPQAPKLKTKIIIP